MSRSQQLRIARSIVAQRLGPTRTSHIFFPSASLPSCQHQQQLATRRQLSTTPRYNNSNPEPTAAPQQDATTTTNPSSSSSNPNPHQKRRRRTILAAAAFLLIGTTAGSLFRELINPHPLPEPGTPDDQAKLQKIRQQAASLPLIQELSADPAWKSWEAYSNDSRDDEREQPRMTSGAMSGSRGLAFQRIFWHAGTGELVSVVYFGAGLFGWPGVVHGGALATVLDETLGRCAIMGFPSKTGVTARLELSYRAPAATQSFYVLRTRPAAADGGPLPAGSPKSDTKMWVVGQLEDMSGRVCVDARALFVVPKGVKLKPIGEQF